MTPPARKPYFFDSTGTGAEFTFPDTAAEMGWLIDQFEMTAATFPHWRTDNDGTAARDIAITVLRHEPEKLLRLGFVCGEVQGTITLEPDTASGYVLVRANVDDKQVFVAYMDHPWEEYELFPPGDATPQGDEGPGRMSKHRWWLSLATAAWPQLAPLAPSGRFNAIVPEVRSGDDR